MSDDYRAALTAAIAEVRVPRREASRDRRTARPTGPDDRHLVAAPGADADGPMGITDACRLVLRGGLPMTPVEVRDRLMAIGVDLSVYSNDLSAIHTVLKRLNEAGEIRLIPRSSGKHAYLWQRPATAIAMSPEIAEFVRGTSRPTRPPAEGASDERPHVLSDGSTRKRSRWPPTCDRQPSSKRWPPSRENSSCRPGHGRSAAKRTS